MEALRDVARDASDGDVCHAVKFFCGFVFVGIERRLGAKAFAFAEGFFICHDITPDAV